MVRIVKMVKMVIMVKNCEKLESMAGEFNMVPDGPTDQPTFEPYELSGTAKNETGKM